MPKETMTSRERWLAVVQRRTPDRVPMAFQGTGEAAEKLRKYLGCRTMKEVDERLHLDSPATVGPAYVGPALVPHTDEFGGKSRLVDYGTGAYVECVFHPLAEYDSVEQIEREYTWPSPDWYDHSAIARQAAAAGDRPIFGGGSEPFFIYKNLRGQERAFLDLVERPEIVHYCLDKLFDLAYENTRRIYEQIPGQVFCSCVAEDMGSQEDLMFSPAHIREFLLPRMKRMVELAHQAGAYVFHHNDGAIRKILPDLIDLGIDILNPIQWRCKGMDRRRLKRDFGDKLIFHGGVDNQHTLAFGSAEDVRREVIDNLEILGAGGGYVLAPCHNIQPVSPPENMVALFETCYEHGWC